MTYNLQMKAVAKTLRQVVEGKAAAQAEAAEWKRKYELEVASKEHKHHNVIKGLFYKQIELVCCYFLTVVTTY
jgi:hypothetical protein